MSIVNDHTVKSMAYSAFFSAFAAALTQRAHPVTMAAIGALAALVHVCADEGLRRLNLHPTSAPIMKSGLPIELTLSLQTVGTLYLTQQVLRLMDSPSFNFAKTAIVMVGLTIIQCRCWGISKTRDYAVFA